MLKKENSMDIININDFEGVTDYELYENDSVKSCIVTQENIFATIYGELIPQYSIGAYGERHKKYRNSISFYENGHIKSVALEKQTPINTPLGLIPGELVTFYEDGSLKRVFPLNGKIDGFWTEEHEGTLCKEQTFDLPIGKRSTKIIAIHFYKSGAIKSLTLWPGETLDVTINSQVYRVRIGISFYENGCVKSIEPDSKIAVNTSIGLIYAYDKDALGIHGDTNSLNFSPNGDLIALTSTHSGIKVKNFSGTSVEWLEPMLIDSIIEDDEKTILPIKIMFQQDTITIIDTQKHNFSLKSNDFTVYVPMTTLPDVCSDCSTCSSCQ